MTAPLVIVPLAVVLVSPALALVAWQSRRGRQASHGRWPGPRAGRERSWARLSFSARSSPRALFTRRRRSPWRSAWVFNSDEGRAARIPAGVASGTLPRELRSWHSPFGSFHSVMRWCATRPDHVPRRRRLGQFALDCSRHAAFRSYEPVWVSIVKQRPSSMRGRRREPLSTWPARPRPGHSLRT